MEDQETVKTIAELNAEQKENKDIPEDQVELDMKSFGDMAIVGGGSKPEYEKLTTATVKSAILMTTKEKQTMVDKKQKNQTYYPVYMKVIYDVEGSEVYENYGGGKLFVSEENNEKRFWLGDNSALGKLKNILEKNFDFSGTIKEIPKLVIGKQVKIRTTESEVAGKIYKKNLIEVFI